MKHKVKKNLMNNLSIKKSCANKLIKFTPLPKKAYSIAKLTVIN